MYYYRNCLNIMCYYRCRQSEHYVTMVTGSLNIICCYRHGQAEHFVTIVKGRLNIMCCYRHKQFGRSFI